MVRRMNKNDKEKIKSARGFSVKALPSGMKCYIMPKKDYGEKIAALCVSFGAKDICYTLSGKEETMPLGTAHFMEHKLFQQKWGDAFVAFGERGASANAFTDFQKTVYYFTCKEEFLENLKLLLEFVQTPLFTQEDTEKEKGIICSEIKMYEDYPDWIVYFNLMKALYENHPIRQSVAGTVESVSEVTAEILQKSYDAFYTTDRFSLVVVGDVEEKEILQMANEVMKPRKNTTKTSLIAEKKEIMQREILEKKDLGEPLFQIGWKGVPKEGNNTLTYWLTMRIALDLLVGESSSFYEDAYEKRWLQEPLGFDTITGEDYSVVAFSGKGDKAQQVAVLLQEKIEEIKEKGISEDDFWRIQKKQIGRTLRSYNGVTSQCMSQIELIPKDGLLYDVIEELKKIRVTDVEKVIAECFEKEQMALSIVK